MPGTAKRFSFDELRKTASLQSTCKADISAAKETYLSLQPILAYNGSFRSILLFSPRPPDQLPIV